LTTLKGAPEYVGGNFYCSYNRLTSLKGVGTVAGMLVATRNPVPEDELLKTIDRD